MSLKPNWIFIYFIIKNEFEKKNGLKAYTSLLYEQFWFNIIQKTKKWSKNRYYFKYDLYSIQPVGDKRVRKFALAGGKYTLWK